MYAITERGESLFEELLVTDSTSGDDDRAFNLKLAFCRYLPPERRIGLLKGPLDASFRGRGVGRRLARAEPCPEAGVPGEPGYTVTVRVKQPKRGKIDRVGLEALVAP